MFVNMFKLCALSICKPLILLFEYSFAPEHFPDIWEKGNIVPVNKRRR